MRTLDATIRPKCVILLFLLIAVSSQVISQTKLASFADLLGWIKNDKPTDDIKSWINQRKVDFELTKDRLNEIKKEWENVKMEDLPGDVEKCIRENFLAPAAPPPPPPPTASLTVECNIQCNLFLDGKPFGTASPNKPYAKSDLQPGRITIRAAAKGYQESKSTIVLIPGDRPNSLIFELEPEKAEKPPKLAGSINVTCTPVDCDVYLDGGKKGTTSRTQLLIPDVSPGNHKIEISKNKFKNQTKPVTVVADAIQSVTFAMNEDLSDKIKKEVVPGMLRYFEQQAPISLESNYTAYWSIADKKQPLTEKVAGSKITWTGSGEYVAKIKAHEAAFNINGILSRINMNQFELGGEPITDNDFTYIKVVTNPDPKDNLKLDDYIKLIAKDNENRYELTLERHEPFWVPVILRQEKINNPTNEATNAACPYKGYGVHENLYMPELVIILNQNNSPELQVHLESIKFEARTAR